MSILVLQSSWWVGESCLICSICLPGVSWWLIGSSSRSHGVVCSLRLWNFLIILIYYFCCRYRLILQNICQLILRGPNAIVLCILIAIRGIEALVEPQHHFHSSVHTSQTDNQLQHQIMYLLVPYLSKTHSWDYRLLDSLCPRQTPQSWCVNASWDDGVSRIIFGSLWPDLWPNF